MKIYGILNICNNNSILKASKSQKRNQIAFKAKNIDISVNSKAGIPDYMLQHITQSFWKENFMKIK